MDETIIVRKKIGERLKKLIDQKVKENDLRNLDALTGKDHSWLAKIFKGEQNFTIDSLTNLLIQFKIQPKDIFDFKINFPKE